MIEEIEGAILKRIQDAATGSDPALGYVIRTVASYGGQIEGPPETVAKRFPAVLVTFGGIRRAAETAVGVWRYDVIFGLVVGNRDARAGVHARTGRGANPGSYRMITDVLNLLVGHDLGLQIERLAPVRTSVLANNKSYSIYTVEVATSFEIDHAADETGALSRLHAGTAPRIGKAHEADYVAMTAEGGPP